MNLRRKRKAFKKFVAYIAGRPSGFGKITAREKQMAMDYYMHGLRVVTEAGDRAAITFLETWPRAVKELMDNEQK